MYLMGVRRMTGAGARSGTEGGGGGFASGPDDCVILELEEALSHCKYAISDQCCRGGMLRTGGSCSLPECGAVLLLYAIRTPSVGLQI
jgi:hypothetical protein